MGRAGGGAFGYDAASKKVLPIDPTDVETLEGADPVV